MCLKNVLSASLGLLLLAGVFQLWSSIDDAPWHPDEMNWIHSSYYYSLIIKADFSNDDWSHFVFYDHPPVGKYIFGLTLHLTRNKTVDTSGGLMVWHRKYLSQSCIPPLLPHESDRTRMSASRKRLLLECCDSLYAGLKPTTPTVLTGNDLKVGRITSLCFALLASALLIAVLTHTTMHIFAGLTAGLVLLQNNVTSPCFQQALADSMCACFALAGFGVLILLGKALARNRNLNQTIIALSLLEGLLVALAVGTKFVTVYLPCCVAITVVANCAVTIWRRNSTDALMPIIAGRAVSCAVVFTSAILLFILSNPFILKAPVRNTFEMVRYREVMMDIQAATQQAAITSFGDRVRSVWGYGVMLGIDFQTSPLQYVLLMFVITSGTSTLIRNAWAELSEGKCGTYSIIGIWVITTFVVNSCGIHMVQERYFVPFAICTSAVVALGANTAVDYVGPWSARVVTKLCTKLRR